MSELNVPDPDYFMEIGHDRTPGSGEKHYRYLLNTPLEKVNILTLHLSIVMIFEEVLIEEMMIFLADY